MCAVADWYKSTFNEDLPDGQAASKIIHKIEKLKQVGDGPALKELAALPWEEHSTLVRISIMRGLWSVTRVEEFRPHYVDLRDRVFKSLANEFGKKRAEFLLRGLFNPEFHVPFSEKLYAVSEDDKD